MSAENATRDDLARRARIAERAKVIVIRKTRLGEPEVDLTPVSGAAAISLATRLTIESFSLAGLEGSPHARGGMLVCFRPRSRA